MGNEVHPVSTFEVWAAGTLFFAVGAGCGGLALGVFNNAGNPADWIAAVGGAAAAAGTWVIGIGANRYAREGEAARKAEARKAFEGRLATLLSASTQLSLIHHIVEDFETRMEGRIALDYLEVTLDYIEATVKGVAPQVIGSMAYFPEFAGAIGGVQIAANNISNTFNEIRKDIAQSTDPVKTQANAVAILKMQTNEMRTPAEFLVAQAAADGDLAATIAERWQKHFKSDS